MNVDLLNEMKCNPKSLAFIESLAISATLSPDTSVRYASRQALAQQYDSFMGCSIDKGQLFLILERDDREVTEYLCNIPENARNLPKYSFLIMPRHF